MNRKRRMFMSMFWIALGAVLVALRLAERVEEFWGSMGFALAVVGGLQLVRHIRYRKDADYREKMDVEEADERNRFLANKAWAWAGYGFVLIASVSIIVFKVVGKDELMMLSSAAVCLMVLLYWGCYTVLKRKY